MRAVRLTEAGIEEVKDLGIGDLVTTEHAFSAFRELYHGLLDGQLKGEYYYRLEEKYFREFCPDVKPLGLGELERKEALEALTQAAIALDDEYLALDATLAVESKITGVLSLIQEITRKMK